VIKPAPGQLAEGAAIELLQQLTDGGVELPQGEVLTVAQHRQDPALDDQYTAFYLSLITGLANSCRDNGHAIMGGHVLIGWVEIRLVAMGLADAGAEVVRNPNNTEQQTTLPTRAHTNTTKTQQRHTRFAIDVHELFRHSLWGASIKANTYECGHSIKYGFVSLWADKLKLA